MNKNIIIAAAALAAALTLTGCGNTAPVETIKPSPVETVTPAPTETAAPSEPSDEAQDEFEDAQNSGKRYEVPAGATTVTIDGEEVAVPEGAIAVRVTTTKDGEKVYSFEQPVSDDLNDLINENN